MTLLSRDESGYTPGDGKGFGCTRCMAYRGAGRPCRVVRDPVGPQNCCNLWGTDAVLPDYAKLSARIVVLVDDRQEGASGFTCDACAYYYPGRCLVVAGPIAPKASCYFWTPRDLGTAPY